MKAKIIKDREELLTKAAAAYHNGASTDGMTDAVWDKHWREHAAARAENPDDPVWECTILDKVGAVSTSGSKVRHSEPMLSLDNVFVGENDSITELLAWLLSKRNSLGMCAIVAEPKIDGLSVRLTYVDGHLKLAATRGDGFYGEDVTANVRAGKLVPLHMNVAPASGNTTEVGGEVFMAYDVLAALNKVRVAAGDPPYANPRNAAAGILRRSDPSEAHHLSFLAHGVVDLEGGSYSAAAQRLDGMRFVPRRRFLGSLEELEGRLGSSLFEHLFGSFGSWIPTDGLVFKLDGAAERALMGETSRAPRWAVALKFKQEQVETTLNAITVQVGRTGTLTPVGELDPVEVDGSVVSRVTLHNEDQVNRLNLCVGDRVVIQKAGGVIPQLVESVTHREIESKKGEIRPPFSLLGHVGGKCPRCGSADVGLRMNADKSSDKRGTLASYACLDPSCSAQMAARIEHMASRACLDLDMLGGEAAVAVAALRIPHPFTVLLWPDTLFASLTWPTQSGGKMTMGKSRGQKVYQAIQRASELPLSRWLASLGIPAVGKNTSKEISRLCRTREDVILACVSPTGLFKAMLDDEATFSATKATFGISHHLGPVSVRKLVEFCGDVVNRDYMRAIPDSVVSDNYDPLPSEPSGALAGKTFVVTGTLSESRSVIQKWITDAGGTAGSSVSKKTDYLVAGEKAGSKLKKANDLGVAVLTEDDLKALIGS